MDSYAVSHHRGERGLKLLNVHLEECDHGEAWVKTWSMTSSIGGSSTSRSITGRSASSAGHAGGLGFGDAKGEAAVFA